MGSKQSLSNGNETEEVTQLIEAFQQHNQVKITITCMVTPHAGKTDTLYTATATNRSTDPQVQNAWALLNAICWGSEKVNLLGLYSTLLYRLDFAIGEKEWGSVPSKSA